MIFILYLFVYIHSSSYIEFGISYNQAYAPQDLQYHAMRLQIGNTLITKTVSDYHGLKRKHVSHKSPFESVEIIEFLALLQRLGNPLGTWHFWKNAITTKSGFYLFRKTRIYPKPLIIFRNCLLGDKFGPFCTKPGSQFFNIQLHHLEICTRI